jgi:hypothetical protein
MGKNWELEMELMDRRGFLRSVVGGAVVVTIATSAGVTLLSNVAEAAPVPADKNLPKAMEDFAETEDLPKTVQYYRYGPYRRRHRRYWRRRRRHCWWRRGRRVCAW